MRDAIKDIRNATGLSQARFALFYDIPKRTIENWESGKTNPPGYVVKLLRRCVAADFGENDEEQDGY